MEAQFEMASDRRQQRLQNGQSEERPPRRAGVLILFYPGEQGPIFPLIRRTEDGTVHSGQVALPGGTYETSDGDLVQTALRECHEEIGVAPDGMEVLGSLSDLYIPPSNFLVTPTVAVLSEPPAFQLDPLEVAAVIEARLEDLLDGSRIKTTEKYGFTVPYFDLEGEVVWGATAMMLSELRRILAPEISRP